MTIYDVRNGVPIVERDENGEPPIPEVYQAGTNHPDFGLSAPLEFDADELLVGESVLIHCKVMAVAPDEEGVVSFAIGGETVDEALKSCIGAFDTQHLGHHAGLSEDAAHPPDWVASTHDGLGRALADYYSCEQRDIAEVLAA